MPWENRSAIVLGAGAASGSHLAQRLASLGVSLFAVDANPDRSDQVVELIRRQGGRAEAWCADISNRFQVSALIERARDQLERISLLVNCTELAPNRDILSLDEWEWRRMVDVNLTGAFFATQLMARVMAEEEGGVIVHAIASPILAGNPATSATRAAIAAFTLHAHERLHEHGVHVLSVTAEPQETQEEMAARILASCRASLLAI
ncbi:MAG: SDR family NAD(P)-dependent oxidoreductase [Anaerolineaceae bacterium]|nr:SDR family NAD(P)-dependent oxidoreductase [Chloroflexota bacterium]MCY4009598.1 SDR family NAD(P)-dependent oxidoreductase [Anaerolineaceae bacterium]